MAAGFGLWLGGKCLAAGKWSDVSQLRAHVRPSTPPAICLIIQLRDGSEVEVHEDAPGWATLLNALPSKLPGTPEPASWVNELRHTTPGEPARMLFERRTLGS